MTKEKYYGLSYGLSLVCALGSSVFLGMAVGFSYSADAGTWFGCGWFLFLVSLRMLVHFSIAALAVEEIHNSQNNEPNK